VRRIGFNNARFDGVGEDTAKKTDGACSRSCSAADNSLSAQFLCLHRNPRLSGHDVLEGLVDVGPGEILNPPGPNKWNDVTLYAASVGDDR
jgi:hypothetical protein